jgi:regulation of enolase protein 1 (concanavalin A-like superfamily)
VTITGTDATIVGDTLTHSTTVSLTVNPPGDFSLSASPASLTVVQGNSGTSTITETDLNGFSGSVSLSASGLPSGVTASFSPNPTTSTSTLTLTASGTAATGTATVTITGTSGSLQHTTTVSLTVNPAPDFSLSASPTSLTVVQGNNGTSTITVNPLNGFSGSVSLSASGLPSGVTASFSPNPTTSTSTLTLTASGTAATGTATVTITGTSGALTHTTTISLTVNPSTSLPAGWTDADIGAVGLAGSASYNNGTFTVSGSGADIWTAADQFNYVYQSVSNDMTIIARVVSESGTASYAKAGVMIRETLATNSVEASVLVTPTNGVAMEVRSTTGAASINVAGWVRSISPPQWVKLVRSGSTFTSYYSADGSTWTQLTSTNVTMNSSATAGLAVSSHDNTSLNTATFDNVNIIEGSVIDTTQIYKLQNEASGLVLNNQGSLTNGSAVTQWTATTVSSNLDWTFIATSNGYYQINSCKSGLDAVVQSASTANGAGIVQWSFGSAGNDQWKPFANSDGSYTFYNLHSGLVLEDPGSSTNKTTQMDQWSANGGSNQKWMLLPQ